MATGLPSGVATRSSLWVEAREGPVEDDHREHRGTGRDVARPRPDRVGRHHPRAGVPLGRAERDSRPQRVGRVEQACAFRREPPGRATGPEHRGKDAAERPRETPRPDQRVEGRQARRIPVRLGGVDREHPRRVADAQDPLARESPVDVASEGREVGQPRQVRLVLEDRLVEVGHAPALGHGEVQRLGQQPARRAGDVVPPCPERHEQLALVVEGDVAVHHRADAHRRDLPQVHAVPGADVGDEGRVGGRETALDVGDRVRPDAVLEPVLPRVRARRERRRVGCDQRRLDARGAELDPEHGGARRDQRRRADLLLRHPGPLVAA